MYLRRNQIDVLTELPDLIEVEDWVQFGPITGATSAADTEVQAIARAHSMGQVRTAQVHRLLVKDSVDVLMREALAEKAATGEPFVAAGRRPSGVGCRARLPRLGVVDLVQHTTASAEPGTVDAVKFLAEGLPTRRGLASSGPVMNSTAAAATSGGKRSAIALRAGCAVPSS